MIGVFLDLFTGRRLRRTVQRADMEILTLASTNETLRRELATARQRILVLEHNHHGLIQRYNAAIKTWLPLVAQVDQLTATVRDLSDQLHGEGS